MNFMKHTEREMYAQKNRYMTSQDLHQDSEFGSIASIQQPSGCRKKPCCDTKLLSKEVIKDQSQISFTNTEVIKAGNDDGGNDPDNNDTGNDQDELPPLTFVDVSSVSVKSEYLCEQERESRVSDALLQNPLDIHPNDCNATDFQNVKEEEGQTKIEIKQEIEIFETDFKISENDSIIKEIKGLSYSDVVPSGNEIMYSYDELSRNVEGTMFSVSQHMDDIHYNPNKTFNRAVNSCFLDDCNLKKSQDLEIKFESICEPDLEEKKPLLTELKVENTEDDDAQFSLKPGNEESPVVSMQAFSKIFRSSTVQKVSSEMEGDLNKCTENEESFDNLLCDPACSSQEKCEHIPSHAADVVHFVSGNTHVKNNRDLISEQCFLCPVCSALFRYPSHLEMHMLTHTGEKPFKCGVCDVSFLQKCTLNVHMRIHTGEKRLKCGMCDVLYREKRSLKSQMRIATGDKPFKCGVCAVSFRLQTGLKSHMRIHTGEKPFKCGVCDVSFRDRGNFKRHMRIHICEKPFKCEVCDVSFRQEGSLKSHMRIHTGEKLFKCGVCNVSFTQKGNLKSHTRIHTGEKPFKCGVCFVSFRGKGSLNSHMRIHTGEKLFKCGVCDVSFRERENLKRHTRIHTGEKPFRCGVCDVSFRDKGSLSRHTQIHTGEKHFKCGVCDVAFRAQWYLKSHMLIHTGEKPFKCGVCDVSFRQKKSLKRHLSIHTDEKAFKCEEEEET